MMDVHDIRALTEEVREAFDASFKAAAHQDEVDTLDLVLIRVEDERYAVPVDELGGIRRCPPLTLVPGQAPGLAGVVGVRGELVVVLSLSALLEKNVEVPSADWLLLAANRSDVALSCSAIEKYLRVAEADISRPAGGSQGDGLRIGVYNNNHEPFEIISVIGWVEEVAAVAGAPSTRSQTR